jgi:hypothetical protein
MWSQSMEKFKSVAGKSTVDASSALALQEVAALGNTDIHHVH